MPFNMFGQDEDEDQLNVAQQPPINIAQQPPVSQPLPVGIDASPESESPSPLLPEAAHESSSDYQITNPLVQAWAKKYADDKYSNANRDKLVSDLNDQASGPNWAAGLAALGAGLSGGNAGQAGQDFLKNQQAQRAAQLANFDEAKKQSRLSAEQDPNSDISRSRRNAARSVLASVAPELANSIDDSMSAADVDAFSKEGLAGKAITGLYGVQGRQITSDRVGERNAIMRGSLDERKNQNSISAGKEFDKDPILLQTNKTLNSLDRANSILQGKEPVTAKSFALLQQDMINAMAPGGSATEGKVNRELVDTLAGNLNDLQLRFGKVKDLRKEQPQVVKNLQNIINTVYSDYDNARANRAKELSSTYDQTSNQQVKSVVGSKQKQYAKKAPAGSQPKTVIQNGHTYTLNEQTGQYE